MGNIPGFFPTFRIKKFIWHSLEAYPPDNDFTENLQRKYHGKGYFLPFAFPGGQYGEWLFVFFYRSVVVGRIGAGIC